MILRKQIAAAEITGSKTSYLAIEGFTTLERLGSQEWPVWPTPIVAFLAEWSEEAAEARAETKAQSRVRLSDSASHPQGGFPSMEEQPNAVTHGLPEHHAISPPGMFITYVYT